MKTSTVLSLAQTAFTLIMYALGIFILGIALFPSVYLIQNFLYSSFGLSLPLRILYLCFMIGFGYFLFGLVLIGVVSLVRIALGFHLKEGVHPIGSIVMLKWMMLNALILLVRSTFMQFILLTPFCALFYRLMGAKIGKNVQINSKEIADIPLLEIGDNVVIGGNATVICHSFEKNGLNIKKVKIGKNAIIGLNSVIMPGSEIGERAVVAAGAIVPKDTQIEAGSVYYGIKK